MTSFTRRLLFGLPLPFVAASSTQAGGPPASRPTTPVTWNETQLYFGTSQPGGGAVSRAQFDWFVDNHVTPRFPDGLTILAGDGQWTGSAGLVKEKSFVLILLYPPQMRDADRFIEEIRQSYKTLFYQESVLRTDSKSTISF